MPTLNNLNKKTKSKASMLKITFIFPPKVYLGPC